MIAAMTIAINAMTVATQIGAKTTATHLATAIAMLGSAAASSFVTSKGVAAVGLGGG